METAKFGRARVGQDAWLRIVGSVGLQHRVYVPVTDYPDTELLGLLQTLSREMKQPVPALLEDLGAFIVPDLLQMVETVIQPQWKTVDLIANTEEAIHQVVRGAGTNTHPPHLSCRRVSERVAAVTYASPRKLCPLAKGIIHGIAAHYGETIQLDEPSCMLKGDAACQLVVTVV